MRKVVLQSALWAVLVSVAAAGAVAQPAVQEKPQKKPAAKQEKQPRTPEDAVTPALKNPERHERFLARIKEGPVGLLFLGDSITDAWPSRGPESWKKFAPYQPADFGISGDRTEHVLWRITHGELEGIRPKAVVVMIGTNNVGHFADEKPEWAAEGVKKIVEVVHARLPETKVLLLGVFPRGAKDSEHRKKVEALNAIISKLGDGKKTVYLDIGAKFLDAEGEIPRDIMPDLLHPTAKGYDVWYEAMWPALEKMLKE